VLSSSPPSFLLPWPLKKTNKTKNKKKVGGRDFWLLPELTTPSTTVLSGQAWELVLGGPDPPLAKEVLSTTSDGSEAKVGWQ